MLYNKPYGAPGSNDPYVNGDPSVGRAGSIPPAEAIEYPQREIVSVITNSGLTPSNGDLSQLARGIQNGKLIFGVDTGTVNNFAAALSPVPLAFPQGMAVRVLMGNAPTGPSVVNFNGLGNSPIVKGGGAALTGGEWNAGDIVTLTRRTSDWQVNAMPPGVVQKLTANRTIYVRMDGNDANDGTANTAQKALRTPQAAINLAFNYAPSQFAITIQVNDGSYGAAITPSYAGPNIILNGTGLNLVGLDGGTTSAAVAVSGPNTLTVTNLNGTNSSSVGLHTPVFLAGSTGANLTINNCAWTGSTDGGVVQAYSGGNVFLQNFTFKGSAAYCLIWANFAGHVSLTQNTSLVVQNAVTVTTGTVIAINGSVGVPIPNPPVWSGVAPTGQRFFCSAAGGIDSSGLGVNYFPGTVAGSTQLSGWFS